MFPEATKGIEQQVESLRSAPSDLSGKAIMTPAQPSEQGNSVDLDTYDF